MRLRRLVAAATAICVTIGLAAVPAGAEVGPGANPETVGAAPLPTWQTNGTVWSVEIVNGVAYVGGNFTKVRPPGAAAGTSEVTRNRLAAFNVATGELLAWAPSASATPYTPPAGTTPDKNCTSLGTGQIECATVWSIEATPDGTSIVVGGDFTAIDGKARAGLAAFSTATGALSTTFKPSVSGRVYSVAATNTRVFAGGGITTAGGLTRTGLAAFDFPSGAVLANWAPEVVRGTTTQGINGVRSIALTADGSRLIVGGGFNALAGVTLHGLAAVDATTGLAAPWNSNRIVSAAYVTSVNVVGDVAYSTADAAGSVSEGIIAFNAATGEEVWYDGCRGASHSMAVVRGVVYVGSHSHDCGAMVDGFGEQYQGYASGDRRRYTLRAEVPADSGRAKLLHWSPRTDDGNGARDMATDGNYLWVAGEFTSVDNAPQQGLTRFAHLGSGGSNRKPITPVAPIVSSTKPGVVDIKWRQTEDPDNRSLVYSLIRDGNTAAPITTVTSAGPPWLQGWMHYQDKQAAGTTHTYEVRATDPLGVLSSRSPQASVVVADSFTPLSGLAVADKATAQYSYGSLVSGKYVDGVSGRTATPGSGVTSAAGNGLSGNAVSLSGSSGGVLVDGLRAYSTRSFTLEALFRTTTNRGGVLASLGDSASTSGVSNNNVGNLYMDNSGRLNFGVRPDGARTTPWTNPFNTLQAVTTTQSFNDGKWHHVAATFEPATGVTILVDGVVRAENTALNWSRSTNAYLRVGGDRVSGWPNTPSSAYFSGTIDEVALYTHPLSTSQVTFHAQTALGVLGAPQDLAGTATGPTGIDLSWQPVVGATSYRVYRDGALVGSPTVPSFSDSGLTASTEYTYSVAGANAAGEGPSSSTVLVKTGPPAPIDLLVSGSVWKYETSGVATAGWAAPVFDDAAWPAGPSQLGHGEGDEATVLTPFMADGTTRRITTYFRTSFDVADAAAVKALALTFKLDDGLVLYLNGTEVLRDNMPAGTIGADTLSSTWAQDDGQTWRTASLPTTALVSGRNVLSAEVHQNARSSLDLTWDASLRASFG